MESWGLALPFSSYFSIKSDVPGWFPGRFSYFHTHTLILAMAYAGTCQVDPQLWTSLPDKGLEPLLRTRDLSSFFQDFLFNAIMWWCLVYSVWALVHFQFEVPGTRKGKKENLSFSNVASCSLEQLWKEISTCEICRWSFRLQKSNVCSVACTCNLGTTRE